MKKHKKNAQARLNEVRAHMKNFKKKNSLPYIKLICNTCKLSFEITTTSFDIYTPEVRKKWTCALCDAKKETGICKKSNRYLDE